MPGKIFASKGSTISSSSSLNADNSAQVVKVLGVAVCHEQGEVGENILYIELGGQKCPRENEGNPPKFEREYEGDRKCMGRQK